ncbi:MAG: SDR family NAD(P)-dependent oxidoreductase [Gammaproteobacteria bacterium]
MNDLQGRVAFVTGAASGIGLGIANALALAGARVALAGKRGEKVAAAAAALKKQGARTLAVELDVTDRTACGRCVDRVERELGDASTEQVRPANLAATGSVSVVPACIEASTRLLDTSVYDNSRS